MVGNMGLAGKDLLAHGRLELAGGAGDSCLGAGRPGVKISGRVARWAAAGSLGR